MTGEIIKMLEREKQPTIIELVRFDPEKPGEVDVLVRCELVENEVRLAGDEAIIKNLRESGIISTQGKAVFPKDGSEFFDSLRTNYRHPYLYAREVK